MLSTLLNEESLAHYADQALIFLRREVSSGSDSGLELHNLAMGLQALASLGRGSTPAAGRTRAFVNSNPHLSLLQALLEEAAHTGRFVRRAAADRGGQSDQHDGGRVPVVGVTELSGQDRTSLKTSTLTRPTDGDVDDDQTVSEDFGDLDIGWSELVFEMARVWRARFSYSLPKAPPKPYKLADDARVILLSDWGNGSDVAVAVADQVRRCISEAGPRECHLVHLGDVYYAGTPWESTNWFLANWPVPHAQTLDADGPVRQSWVLNGNHDMYCAGEGLQVILNDPRFAQQKTVDEGPTTQFQLRSDRLQILGLDSSWKFDPLDYCNLKGQLGTGQADWLTRQAAPNTIVLTHHQPVSRQSDYPAALVQESVLLTETAAARAQHRFLGWFWGHEHRCVVYGSPAGVDGIRYGACTGHGAMPEAVAEPPLAMGPGEWEFNEAQTPDTAGDTWRRCGFTVLDLAPDTVTVTYYDQDGIICRAPDVLDLQPATTAAATAEAAVRQPPDPISQTQSSDAATSTAASTAADTAAETVAPLETIAGSQANDAAGRAVGGEDGDAASGVAGDAIGELADASAALGDPTAAFTDSRGFSYVEASGRWKQMCEALPSFADLRWPLYDSASVEVTLKGEPAVIQLWRGWCQKFLLQDNFPGGIGAEVGVYRRQPGRSWSMPDLNFLSEAEQATIRARLAMVDADNLWWPAPDLVDEISFELVNPVTGEQFFSAGPQGSYWLCRWMQDSSYLRYAETQGLGRLPLLPDHYTMLYSVNNVSRQWPGMPQPPQQPLLPRWPWTIPPVLIAGWRRLSSMRLPGSPSVPR